MTRSLASATWCRRIVIGVVVATLVGTSATPVSADTPTPRGGKIWSNGELVTYEWGVWTIGTTQYAVPSWVKTIMNNVMQTTYQDPATNNADGPWFTYSTTNDVVVYFSPDNPVHTTNGWLGSADSTTTPKRIWLRSDPTTPGYEQWCHFATISGCPDTGRAGIHEVIHIGGYISHNPTTSWTETRMHTTVYPFNPTSTWNLRTLGKCDAAAMQLWYDLADKAGHYANCFDHISNHGVEGLITDLTVSPSSITVCSGVSVTVTGRLQVHDFPSYEALGGNGLWGRTLWIDRGSTVKYTSTTVDSTGGNNWSKTFTGSNVTYNYVAHYDRTIGEGLDNSPDRPFSITWLSPQEPC
jgi:hypothetical protein